MKRLTAVTRYVGVIGPGDATEQQVGLAAEVGRLLAEAGVVVVCGGLGGIMDGVCEGARAAGGVTVGVLPGDDRSDGNPYLSVSIPTGLGQLRNALIIRSSQAVIAIGGSWGTLNEITLARRAGLPVVVMDGWQIRDEQGRDQSFGVPATSAVEAVGLALDAIGPD